LRDRHPRLDWAAVDDVVYGCANQAGEDNRNVGRMASLLADLPDTVPASTVNRLCGSSMDAVATAARAIATGEMSLVIAGGVESMSRAPFVVPKADGPFSRALTLEDTTLGWRFVNPEMRRRFGVDSMSETAEHVAAEYRVSRQADAAALIVVLNVVRAEEKVIPSALADDGWRPDGAPRPHDIGGVEDARVLGPGHEVGGRERVEEQLLVVHRRIRRVDPVRRLAIGAGKHARLGVRIPAGKNGIAGAGREPSDSIPWRHKGSSTGTQCTEGERSAVHWHDATIGSCWD
jgi:hypothetical protein